MLIYFKPWKGKASWSPCTSQWSLASHRDTQRGSSQWVRNPRKLIHQSVSLKDFLPGHLCSQKMSTFFTAEIILHSSQVLLLQRPGSNEAAQENTNGRSIHWNNWFSQHWAAHLCQYHVIRHLLAWTVWSFSDWIALSFIC